MIVEVTKTWFVEVEEKLIPTLSLKSLLSEIGSKEPQLTSGHVVGSLGSPGAELMSPKTSAVDKSSSVEDTAANDDSSALRVGRSIIRTGDQVRVAPSKKYARDGFVGTFRRTEVLPDGRIKAWVTGAIKGRAPAERSFDLDRLQMVRPTSK